MRSRLLVLGVAASLASGVTAATVVARPARAATCSDVEVVFARGTGEPAGLGSVGGPFVRSLASALPGRTVTSYAVRYAASWSQTSAGPGATDMTNHVTTMATSCPATRFVLGGYSQGATVTDVALGIRTGTTTGASIPAAVSPRVAAVVVFGNPLGLSGRTIASASPTYAARSRDYCNTGDPVCGAGFNTLAHLMYVSNGSTTRGAQFAASLLGG